MKLRKTVAQTVESAPIYESPSSKFQGVFDENCRYPSGVEPLLDLYPTRCVELLDYTPMGRLNGSINLNRYIGWRKPDSAMPPIYHLRIGVWHCDKLAAGVFNGNRKSRRKYFPDLDA
ncbi:MAG: hypothetical protein AB1757_27735 [Acidobacteriota bacterium]